MNVNGPSTAVVPNRRRTFSQKGRNETAAAWQLRRSTCFTRGRTGLRRAGIIYNQSKRRLDVGQLGNHRRIAIGGLLRLFCKNGDWCFQRSQKLPA
jgi:hypothetical protein